MEVNGQCNVLAALPPLKAILYPLVRSLGGPQVQSGLFGQNKSLLPPVGIRALGCPAHSLLAVLTVLSWLLYILVQTLWYTPQIQNVVRVTVGCVVNHSTKCIAPGQCIKYDMYFTWSTLLLCLLPTGVTMAQRQLLHSLASPHCYCL